MTFLLLRSISLHYKWELQHLYIQWYQIILLYIFLLIDSHINILFTFQSVYIGTLFSILQFTRATKMVSAPKIIVILHTFPFSSSNTSTVLLVTYHIHFQIVFQHLIMCSTQKSNDIHLLKGCFIFPTIFGSVLRKDFLEINTET